MKIRKIIGKSYEVYEYADFKVRNNFQKILLSTKFGHL